MANQANGIIGHGDVNHSYDFIARRPVDARFVNRVNDMYSIFGRWNFSTDNKHFDFLRAGFVRRPYENIREHHLL